MFGADLGGSSYTAIGTSDDIAHSISTTVKPVPANHWAVITNIVFFSWDDVQNQRFVYVTQNHGHGVFFAIRKGNVRQNVSGVSGAVVPPGVSPYSQVSGHFGGFYGLDAPWALPAQIPNGYIKQGSHFSSRIYLELKADEFLTVSVSRLTGLDIHGGAGPTYPASGPYELKCSIAFKGWLLPLGYQLDLRHMAVGMTL